MLFFSGTLIKSNSAKFIALCVRKVFKNSSKFRRYLTLEIQCVKDCVKLDLATSFFKIETLRLLELVKNPNPNTFIQILPASLWKVDYEKL